MDNTNTYSNFSSNSNTNSNTNTISLNTELYFQNIKELKEYFEKQRQRRKQEKQTMLSSEQHPPSDSHL